MSKKNEIPAVVASQLPVTFNDVFQRVMPRTRIVTASCDDSLFLEPEIEILLAAPYRSAGGQLPEQPPAGWPFGLKWIQLVSSGLDFYPSWFWRVAQVTSLHGASALSLAELALALIFAHAKQAPDLWIESADDWRIRLMRDVSGSVLGVFGYGSLAHELIPRAQALGMRVAVCRRSSAPLFHDDVMKVHSLQELMTMSDHLLLAAPDTPETRGVVNRQSLQYARPGLHLINLARGSLVDDAALIDALDSGLLSRASLDVAHPEPLPAGHPLYTHPRVYLSPHVGTMSPGSMRKMGDMFAANLERYCRGQALQEITSQPQAD